MTRIEITKIEEKYPTVYKAISNMYFDSGSPAGLHDLVFVFEDGELELLEEKLGKLEGKTIGDLLTKVDIRNQMRMQGLYFTTNEVELKDWDAIRKEDALEEYTCGMSIYIQALDRMVVGPKVGKLVADIFNQL